MWRVCNYLTIGNWALPSPRHRARVTSSPSRPSPSRGSSIRPCSRALTFDPFPSRAGLSRISWDLAAETDGALIVPEERLAGLRALVDESGALFGARHYRSHHTLLALSDHIEPYALEHAESSDCGFGERYL